jgi:hypothetical protein
MKCKHFQNYTFSNSKHNALSTKMQKVILYEIKYEDDWNKCVEELWLG